jgi:AraC-like DNA-binding protein
VDVLAEIMAVANVRGTVAARVDAGEPWGLELGEVNGAAFHTITSGTAWLRVPGQAPVHLAPGDVVLLATGAEHGLASTPDGPLEPFDHLAAERAFEAGGVMRIGVGEVRTRILCASYQHDPATATPLLSLLPEVLHLPGGSGHRGVDDTVRLLASELSEPLLATPTILDRLVDVLLIQLVRAWQSSTGPDLPASWLMGLRDPAVAAALHAMHARPGEPWTIDRLAREVTVSRATLARRFPTLVGLTPAAYLTRWRMDLAARQLRDTDQPIDVIAGRVGYTSEYAFSRAFSRARSVPPGRYRHLSRSTRPG